MNITPVLYECSMPWYIILMVRQSCIKITMCSAVDCCSLQFTISVALIGIKESAIVRNN